ncbi:hypothetical protein [Bradyrhizobium liaoningense]|uniref:hypothetical protein n=1 Tax=Bradyrhizobium liaoningense TaxID=43992 RepID=UPI001BA48510|nr:hypothetical protein [Bradyrhizobium liaoningense]MBR0715599.1 hypothetical protein [Bradyrhizobium liaoningense]
MAATPDSNVDSLEPAPPAAETATPGAIDAVVVETVTTDNSEHGSVENRTVEAAAVGVDTVKFASAGVEPVVAETVESDVTRAISPEAEIVAVESFAPVAVEPVATDTVENNVASATAPEIEIVEIELIAPITVEQAPAATEIVETAVLADVVETDSVAVEAAEPAIADATSLATDIVESSAVQPVPAEADAPTLLAVEPETVASQPAETDIVAFAVVPDDVIEPVSVVAEVATPVAQPSGLSEREELIRRRWKETGVRMWNARTHGAGQAVLCIQGSVKLLPPKPGETMPQYDRLEFQLVDGRIVCEGFEVDAPEAPRQRAFASAAG